MLWALCTAMMASVSLCEVSMFGPMMISLAVSNFISYLDLCVRRVLRRAIGASTTSIPAIFPTVSYVFPAVTYVLALVATIFHTV